MSAAIAMQNISLYIPHVFPNITGKKIVDVFESQYIGNVRNVDLIPKKDSNGKPYNAAYIHFYEWCDNIAARNFQERVLDKSKEARIIYDEPWHWIVLENKTKKMIPGDRKPTINLNAFGYKKPSIIPGFDCGHTPEKEQAKPTNYISPAKFKSVLNDIISENRNRPKREKPIVIASDEMDIDMELQNAEKNLFIELADLKAENSELKKELETFKKLYAVATENEQILRMQLGCALMEE